MSFRERNARIFAKRMSTLSKVVQTLKSHGVTLEEAIVLILHITHIFAGRYYRVTFEDLRNVWNSEETTD